MLSNQQIEIKLRNTNKAIWRDYVAKSESFKIDAFNKKLIINKKDVISREPMVLTYKYDSMFNLKFESYRCISE